MPSTVDEILAAAGLEAAGCVRWGEQVPEQWPGVYIVALTDRRGSVVPALPDCPISTERVRHLLDARPELRLDGERRTVPELAARYAGFWLPDEVVLYVGLASTSVSDRVRADYRTGLGKRSPHAGGYWLKLLTVLDDLIVHFAPCSNVADAEMSMASAFVAGVSPTVRAKLYDPASPLPFANRKAPPHGPLKRHGITGDTQPKRRG